MLYSLHNGLAPLHKYTSTRVSYAVHQSALACLTSCWVTLRLTVLYAAWFWSGVPHHWTYLWPQGAVPSSFRGVGLMSWRLRLSSLGEEPAGPEAFLKMPGVCGLWPCTRTHLKKALCQTHSVGGTEEKYRTPISVTQSRVDTICIVDG